MKCDKTDRGFDIVEFTDKYGVKCSLQKSSLATEDAIWFGCDDPNPQIMASDAIKHGIPTYGKTTGWIPIPLPPPHEMVINTRMHLTQDQVKELLPHLIKFVETGEL